MMAALYPMADFSTYRHSIAHCDCCSYRRPARDDSHARRALISHMRQAHGFIPMTCSQPLCSWEGFARPGECQDVRDTHLRAEHGYVTISCTQGECGHTVTARSVSDGVEALKRHLSVEHHILATSHPYDATYRSHAQRRERLRTGQLGSFEQLVHPRGRAANFDSAGVLELLTLVGRRKQG